MPKRGRAAAADEDDDATQVGASPSQSTQAAGLSGEDLGLADGVCRFVLLREHAKKPFSRADLKEAVLGKERKDPGGRILKGAITAANLKLLATCGLELVADSDAAAAEDDGGAATQAGASQAAASQSCSQGATQGAGAKAAKAKGELLLLNRLENPVKRQLPDEVVVYHALVEVVLGIIEHNEGKVAEAQMYEAWLPRLGLTSESELPHCRGHKVCDLVGKRMIGEAWLRRVKEKDGEAYLSPGSRAVLCRNAESAADFKRDRLEDAAA